MGRRLRYGILIFSLGLGLPVEVLAQPPLELQRIPLFPADTTLYLFDSVRVIDRAERADGYWLYAPVGATDSTTVVLFLHGYGGYNPMIYGAWIKHLVRRGNVVLYPRYQRNVFQPATPQFVPNVLTALRDARSFIASDPELPEVDWEQVIVVGHSYGGVIGAHLATRYASIGLPRFAGLLALAPGTAIFKGGLLDDYSQLPSETVTLIVTNENDQVVGEIFPNHFVRSGPDTLSTYWLRQLAIETDSLSVTAHHNEAYAPDLAFDTGVRNFTAQKALRVGRIDAIDLNGYWRWLDAMINCARHGWHCELATGDRMLDFGRSGDLFESVPIHLTLPSPATPSQD